MGHPGIVFFSSGTTGTPKAAVHDLMPYIHRFEEPGKTLRSMAFLLFDHAGGFNTVIALDFECRTYGDFVKKNTG